MEKKYYIFAYGTLQLPEIQNLVLAREVHTIKNQSLRGYKLGQLIIEGISYMVAVESEPEDEIYGSIIEVYEKDLPLIDGFETDAYTRINLYNTGYDHPCYMYIKS